MLSGGKAKQATLFRSVFVSILLSLNSVVRGIADPNRILVELGQSGGQHPHVDVLIESILSRQLGAVGTLVENYSDLRPFSMKVLHPGRTLLEKLLRVHVRRPVSETSRTTGNSESGVSFTTLAPCYRTRESELLADSGERDAILDDCLRVPPNSTETYPDPKEGSRCHRPSRETVTSESGSERPTTRRWLACTSTTASTSDRRNTCRCSCTCRTHLALLGFRISVVENLTYREGRRRGRRFRRH